MAGCRETALRLLASRARTRRSLALALLERGFPEAEVEAVVAALAAEIPELGKAGEAERLEAELGERARRLATGLTPAARSKKLLAGLLRRGFPPDAVREALRKKGLLHEDDDVDLGEGP